MGQDDIYEYYHPETGEPPPKAAPIFGWSAAVFIDLAIQASREPKPRARGRRRGPRQIAEHAGTGAS